MTGHTVDGFMLIIDSVAFSGQLVTQMGDSYHGHCFESVAQIHFQQKQKLGTSTVTKLCHRLETIMFPTNVITVFSRI